MKKTINEKRGNEYKAGYAVIIGRPNSGKSTLLNNILKQKVSVTSPKPQTTRFAIEAVYEDDRGQVIFIDTPGIFSKVQDETSRKINPIAESIVNQSPDVIIYLVDHTRERKTEENKILGIVRKINKPKILAINKSDIKKPSFLPHYKFMESEFDKVITISGLFRKNLNLLIDAIFEFLPIQEKIINTEDLASPLINMDSKMFISEIIREKAFLFLRKELPYTLQVITDEIFEKDNNLTVIKGRIITTDVKYKKMIIGDKGYMIKEIGTAARKELETATGRKIFLDLAVETNPHW